MFSRRTFIRPDYLSAGFGLLVQIALLLMPAHLAAQTGKSITALENICLAEAQRAEARHGIPAGLMQSITRVESGRKMVTGEYMPWAWTLNDQGEGLFFDTRETALAYLVKAVATPDHSVDVGCMQVNTKWHADGFLDIADMLDPVHNASYAAGFLLDLHAAHQSWDEAVKHYHSAEPRKNVVYHRRVLAELERYIDRGAAPAPTPGADDSVMLAAAPADLPADDVVSPMPDEGSADSAAIAPLPDLSALVSGPVAAPAAVSAPQVAVPAGVTPVTAPSAGALLPDQPSPDQPSPDQPSPDQTIAGDPVWEKQPNLAPHRSRVEQFRRILAQQAG
jgi:hypothetical protein